MKTSIIVTLFVLGFSSAATAQSTGYPACDKYISMVSACIKTKMPPAERPERQEQLDHFRDMLQGLFGAQLAGSCAENIRIEIQRDRYGCYAAGAAAAGLRTPCSLVAPNELAKILGIPLAAGRPANSACEYDSLKTPGRAVRIEVKWSGGRDEMKGWRDGLQIVQQDVRQQTGQKAPIEAETVRGVGDDNVLMLVGFTPMMAARKGDVAVTVEAHVATRAQLIDIVRTVLERIP